MTIKSNQMWEHYGYFIIILLVAMVGLFIRLKGLTLWPLTIDEYYIIASVKNIINTNVPEFSAGGYYTRGVLYQYLIYGLGLLGNNIEFAARFISVVANLICLIPVYLLSNKISGKFVTTIIVFIFCFSAWEVEFARFARMYSLFQMIFMWYTLFLVKYMLDKDFGSINWLLILSFTSIFIFEGSIFLSLLNFIPLFWNPDKKNIEFYFLKNTDSRITHILLILSVFTINYLFLTINFRFLGFSITDLLPPDIDLNNIVILKNTFRLPKVLLFKSIQQYSSLFLIIILAVLIGLGYYKYIFQNHDLNYKIKILTVFVLGLSFFNLFGLSIVILILLYILNFFNSKELFSFAKFYIPVLITLLIIWTIFGLANDLWFDYFPNKHLLSNTDKIIVLWKEFINYPYFYETFVLFRETVPNFTYFMLFSLSFSTTYFVIHKTVDNLQVRLVLSILISVIILTTSLELLYFQTRYFFYFYPLVLILTFTSFYKIATNIVSSILIRRCIFLTFVFIFLFFSEDFNLNHVIKIDSETVNYRYQMNRWEKDHYYPRWDTRTPAEFINGRVQSDEIIIINEQVYDYYLNKSDYMYYNFRGPDFLGISVKNGKKERWTNANLIFDSEELMKKLTNSKENIWLLINTFYGNRDLESVSFFKHFENNKVYQSRDGVTFVYKIPGKIKYLSQ